MTPGQDGFDRDGRDRHADRSSRAKDPYKDSHRDSHRDSRGKDRSSKAVATASPPRGREQHKTTGTRGGGANVRSSTMPAAGKWWQNPLLQAGARTALSAGAQAAMNNRKGQGEWLGAKGAKVATAAIGAALMDGFMQGDKKDGGKDDRDRGRGRSYSRSRSRSRDKGSRGKSSGRSKSEGRGSGMRDKILQSGMDFMMKKATGGR